jgi:hypothetical protein
MFTTVAQRNDTHLSIRTQLCATLTGGKSAALGQGQLGSTA